ncbi:MAG: hypothetical protein LBU46_07960 [Candidatus Accumulibacter sp.]|jgi:GNAT superfamily N-acetyltransferase|nr:hypothetical protein [Accumulibacter sp.]
MLKKLRSVARGVERQATRKMLPWLPKNQRFKILRSFVDCHPSPSSRLVLKIAETQEELEGCFRLLHDVYVDDGFMKPHPSGMRVTIYHALPATLTLCAKYDDQVVGTLSLIRESALGLPLQKIFDLSAVVKKKGQIAEVSALAVDKGFRKTGSAILFPLMKFMYEYCTAFLDIRHLVIAVNPGRIEMYESLLFFQRLSERVVESYDFVNGAPAVGATLDLKEAPEIFRRHYASKPPQRNLYAYFTQVRLPNIEFPDRRSQATNDPVLTPELIDYFFNIRTDTFRNLSTRKKVLLHSIYDLPAYRAVLPKLPARADSIPIRHHERFPVRCPAKLMAQGMGEDQGIPIEIVEVSEQGFRASANVPLPLNVWFETAVQLGHGDVSRVRSMTLHGNSDGTDGFYGFNLEEPDLLWRKFVSALYHSKIYSDLETPTQVLR